MSFISKDSIRNPFYSNLVTSIPRTINPKDTEIHIFYAKRMGEKYLARYREHFRHPIVHEQDIRHEEFLGVYPEQWCRLVKEVLNGNTHF